MRPAEMQEELDRLAAEAAATRERLAAVRAQLGEARTLVESLRVSLVALAEGNTGADATPPADEPQGG